jgi:hypothetical protein
MLVPTKSTFLQVDSKRVDSFLGYSAVFMKKGQIFLKESTLYGNSYYKKEDGRSYSFAQFVYVVQSHITH